MSFLLPETLGESLIMAMDDLEVIEAKPEFKISIDDCWYQPMAGYTMVCLAGVVIAQRMVLDEDYRPLNDGSVFPSNCLDPRNRQRLLAIDWIGYGAIQAAMDDFYGGHCGSPRTLKLKTEQREEWFIPVKELVSTYGENPTKWKREMREIAAQLVNAGI